MKLRLVILSLLFCFSIHLVNAQTEAATKENFTKHFNTGLEEFKAKDYTSALSELIAAADIYKQRYNVEKDKGYQMLLGIIAICTQLSSNYQMGLPFAKEYVTITKNRRGMDHPDYATSLNNLASYYSHLGNYNEAVRLGTEAMEINKKVLGTEHPDYALSLNNLAGYYSKLGNYDEAVRLDTEAMEIRRKVLGSDHPDYALSLNNLASYYSKLGNYGEAVRLATEAMEIHKKVLGTEHPDYAISLNNLAGYYSDLGNYGEAVRLGTEAMGISKEILGTDHPNYALSLNNLVSYYSKLGNYSEAVRLGTEVMEIRRKVLGTDHPDYATSLSNLANYYSHLGNHSEAVRLGTEAMEIRRKVLGTEHPDYATSLSNLAGYYSELGNYSESVRLGAEAMKIRKKVLGTEHPNYTKSLSNLATYYWHLGNYGEAVRLGTEAMEIEKKLLGTEHPDYAISLNNLATYYSYLGNYDEAGRLATEAMEIRKKVLGTEHPDNALSLNNLAGYYSDLGNYNEAVRLSTEAMEIYKKALGTEHPDYATLLNNLAGYFSYLGNYNEAVRLSTEAMEIYKKALGTEHPDYAISLNNLASYYSHLDNYSEAVRLRTEAIEICKKVLGTEHPNYATLLNNLAGYYVNSGSYSMATKFAKSAMDVTRNHVLSNFAGLNSTERMMFWNTHEYGFTTFYPRLFYRANEPTQAGVVYDNCALFAKGLLLNAETEMRKLIQESGNAAALTKFDELRNHQVMLNKELEKSFDKRQMDCDSLRAVIEQEERELARMSTAFGDFTRNLRLTWQDVQRNLKEDDIAVEFLSFPMENSDSVMYIALTLRKNDAMPRMVTMFEQKQLKMDDRAAFTADPAMTEVIWGSLSDVLKGVKNIYFAPSGELHRLGIEYLPGMEAYNIYRLSSTRELVNREHERGNGAVLYGDINYNTSLKTLAEKAQTTKNDETMFAYNSVPALRGGNSLRGEVGHLTGSKREVEAIHKLLPSSTLLEYNDATEESFKALSGKRVAIIHLSTHGRYYTPDASDLNHKASFIRMGDDSRSVEDKALTRSCLMMAGANNVLGDDPETVDGVDDGVLTAKEIAQVDLRGCDLAVLSACETALGDLGSGEGVFGLQRGFKKAGVQTLLMSLWPVDDTATEILMTEFYRQLVAGKTKRDAFQSAQHHLRTTDGGKWNSPQYWASFILLDSN